MNHVRAGFSATLSIVQDSWRTNIGPLLDLQIEWCGHGGPGVPLDYWPLKPAQLALSREERVYQYPQIEWCGRGGEIYWNLNWPPEPAQLALPREERVYFDPQIEWCGYEGGDWQVHGWPDDELPYVNYTIRSKYLNPTMIAEGVNCNTRIAKQPDQGLLVACECRGTTIHIPDTILSRCAPTNASTF